MRLINTKTLRLEDVQEEKVEEYAILSHRWEETGEISFQDMQDLQVASKMRGFSKILKACKQALKDNMSYIWIDTCCINKQSSAELSEAINSMYRWYEASAVCYAYLFDVRSMSTDEPMRNSVWFKRGWTLQELLAPLVVTFYDREWQFLGTKQTLSDLLTTETGIDKAILNGGDLFKCSVAQRMSWASHRVTTRPEDMAYCLLGLFDVNMPLLYGERHKAFLRLQEQIVRQSDDHSLFAWSIYGSDQPGLLASSPEAFRGCRNIKALTSRKGRAPYSLTNRGLSIKLMATPFTTDTYLVRLDCVDESLQDDGAELGEYRLGMFLRRLSEDNQYARVEWKCKTFMQVNVATWAYYFELSAILQKHFLDVINVSNLDGSRNW